MSHRTTSRILLAIVLLMFALVFVVGVFVISRRRTRMDPYFIQYVDEDAISTQTAIAVSWTATPVPPTPIPRSVPDLYRLTLSNFYNMKLVLNIPLLHAINAFTFSSDSNIIGAATSGGVYLYYTYAGSLFWLDDTDQSYTTVAFSPDNKMLAAGADDGLIRVWDVALRKQIQQIPVKSDESGEAKSFELTSLAFSADSRTLVSGDSRGIIWFWDMKTFKPQDRRGTLDDKFIRDVTFHPSRDILAVGDQLGNVYLWKGDQTPQTLRGQGVAVRTLKFNLSGKLLASGDVEGTVRLLDLETGRELWSNNKSTEGNIVIGISFNASSDILAVTVDAGATLIDVQTGADIARIVGDKGPSRDVVFSPDGKMLCAGGSEGVLHIWGIPAQGDTTPKP